MLLHEPGVPEPPPLAPANAVDQQLVASLRAGDESARGQDSGPRQEVTGEEVAA